MPPHAVQVKAKGRNPQFREEPFAATCFGFDSRRGHVNLPKKFNPEMLDERPNVGESLAFVHDFQIDEELDCPRDCRNSAHHRLLNLDTQTEITTSFERIDAMRELWHGGN